MESGAAVAAASVAWREAKTLQGASPITLKVTPLTQFEYGDVQLLDGPMLEQFKHSQTLFLNLNEDSLLKPFRQLAGMPAPGEDKGGWYWPSSQFDPPKDMTGYLPGHSFGQ